MYKRIILKYKKRYIKLLKEIFEDIKKDKDLKYLYFDREQKKFVENILNKSSFTILFGLYFKTFRRLIINSYDYNGVYRIVKITTKPARLQISILNQRLDYFTMLNKKLYKEIKYRKIYLIKRKNYRRIIHIIYPHFYGSFFKIKYFIVINLCNLIIYIYNTIIYIRY